jgi:Nif-specific regulatory protein
MNTEEANGNAIFLGSEKDELSLLLDIACTFGKYPELRAALAPVLSILELRAGLKRGMVTLLNRATGMLKVEEAVGLTQAEKARGVYRLGEGLVGRVFETGQPIITADLSCEDRFLNRAVNRTKTDMDGVAWYCVPVHSGGTVIGTLSAERPAGYTGDSGNGEADDGLRQLHQRDMAFMERVAAIIADSAKLRERIMEDMAAAGSAGGSWTGGGSDNIGTGSVVAGGRQRRLAVEPGGVCNTDTDAVGIGGIGSLGDNGAVTATTYHSGSIASGGYATGFSTIGEGSSIIGTSSAMRDVYGLLTTVGPSEATVLICGESGTGKELIAAELQRLSRRAGKPFLKINCAALPQSIIESELFGHEKGAFTGAVSKHKGRFEQADGGTLFLDEIAELPAQIQVKLLRVLQEHEVQRVGGEGAVKVDVRLIAATNKNLEEQTRNGLFREDLFYRLNVFPLFIPPLRERKADIILLADYFTEKYSKKNRKLIKRISTPALDLLSSYTWPGNVRELENCVERAVILSKDMVIHSYDLPPSLQSAQSTHTELDGSLGAALSRLEKEMIIEALKVCRGNVSQASLRLSITERQLGLRLKHYGIPFRLYRPVK